MKRILLLAVFLLLGVSTVKAENTATGYSSNGVYQDQQIFVEAYNNSASTLAINTVAVIDTTAAINPNVNLGAYITTNGSTTDSVFVFGVTDEAIVTKQLGRVCVRGPHKVVIPSGLAAISGKTMGACASSANACPVTTATGTSRGFLGNILSTTASTDTGDAANTFWLWVRLGTAN